MPLRQIFAILCVLCLAITCSACDKKDSAADEVDRSPKAICEHTAEFVDVVKQKGCTEGLEKVEGHIDEEDWNTFADCALAANSDAELEPCFEPLVDAALGGETAPTEGSGSSDDKPEQ